MLDWMAREDENYAALKRFWNDKDKFFGHSDERNIDCFKRLIIDECFLDQHSPDAPEYKERIETLFREIKEGKVDFDSFFKRLEGNPSYNIPRLIKLFESGALPEIEIADFEVTPEHVETIQGYMAERGSSAVVCIGSIRASIPHASRTTSGIIETQLTTLASEGNNPSDVFSMWSIEKIFTGMLVFKMLEAGVITENDLDNPVLFFLKKRIPDITDRLSADVVNRLSIVTWHQIMTHRSGIDFSMPGLDKEKLARREKGIPQIDSMVTLLQFIDEAVSPIDEIKYSNAGMLLIGFAIEQAYENKFGEHLDFNAILKKYIIDEIGMSSFSITMPKNAKRHDPNYFAPFDNNIDASFVESTTVSYPFGSAWINAQDLAKFGTWICREYSKHGSSKISFKDFLEKYGQESYHAHNKTIVHPGTSPFASSYFSFSLKTGALLVILSNQPCVADDLAMMVRSEVFRKPNEPTLQIMPVV